MAITSTPQPKVSAEPPPWYAGALSPEQCDAVRRCQSTCSIFASAGSGKTKTLVYSLANDLLNGVEPEQIIAFTFTKKAAEELLTRVHLLLRQLGQSKSLNGLSIGTIHSWCLQYLLDNSRYYNFDPIEEDIRLYALAARLYDQLGLEAAYGQTYPAAVPTFLKDIELFYNECLTLADVPTQIRPAFKAFLDVMTDNRLVSFGGMIQYAIDILRKDGPVTKLKRLYVDEYQDVNPAQVELIRLMLPQHAQAVVVGDDLQCIYNWRGSDVTRILDFPTQFNAPNPAMLTENYRSRPVLVTFSNDVADNIVRRYPKTMTPKRLPSIGAAAYHQSFNDEQQQAETIARIVSQFHAKGVPYNKIAVLLRSVRGAGPPIVQALESKGIPVECPILSRGGAFLDAFVLPLFEWLKDEHKEAHNEQEEVNQVQKTQAFWNTVSQWLGQGFDSSIFWIKLNGWLDAISNNDSTAYDVRGRFYDFLNSCGILVRQDSHELIVSLGIATQIIRAVEEIQRRRIRATTRKSARQVMRDVFYALVYNKDTFGESLPVNTASEGVVVTTVHQAKGLEWPIVIVPTLNRNRFPLRNSSHTTSFPASVSARYGTTEEDEWRLFYVACTRARERLLLFDFAAGDIRKQSVFLQRLASKVVTKDFLNPETANSSVFQIDPADLKTADPPPVRVGLSDLLLYVECPFQFALRRVAGIQPSIADDLGYGKSIHELAQRRYKDGQNWDEKKLDDNVENHVHLPYVGEKQLEKSKTAIKNRLRALEKAGAFVGTVEPELHVEVTFDDGIVDGTIDSVVASDTGLAVIDWKTNVHPEFIGRYGEQLHFYVHALRELGRTVNSAELVDVGATTKESKLVSIAVPIGDSEVSSTVARLSTALHGVKYQQFLQTPSELSCRLCDMKRICSYRVTDAHISEG